MEIRITQTLSLCDCSTSVFDMIIEVNRLRLVNRLNLTCAGGGFDVLNLAVATIWCVGTQLPDIYTLLGLLQGNGARKIWSGRAGDVMNNPS